MRKSGSRNLREACVEEAFAIIGETGVEGLSIREVARRLGVSHQAPYKHFPSSQHLLAEIIRRTYVQFAAHLRHRPLTGHPAADMHSLGEAYFAFAMQHPLHYRLMFGTPLEDPSAHPETMRAAQEAFGVLLQAIAALRGRSPDWVTTAEDRLDALFVWSAVHGLATILHSNALSRTGIVNLPPGQAFAEILRRIGRAMGVEPPTAPPR